ncbi:SRPBCC family protein [Flavobacterium commune]|uniref:ATPase n=1 Tax=Flavobacterium commune TaxID=1306519 RepID=A0A1D9PEM0_9FLAO|nr:ATPase [Flavobacterium commune]APA00938.1 ATPase [Flavobacterium commune]
METLTFKVEIQAPREKVWSVLWEDASYRKWATVFCEGTYAISDWTEGSIIQFLTPNGEGMYSVIEEKIENEYMAFKHLSMMKNFEVLPVDAANQEWVGATESYRLTSSDGITVLKATVDTVDKYVDYFNTTFLKALMIIKELSEE